MQDMWRAAELYSRSEVEDSWLLPETLGNFIDLGVQQLLVFLNPRVPVVAVAYSDDQAVGMVEVTEDGYVRNLVVDEAFRRQGIATKLIAWSKMRSRERGASKLFLHVSSSNQAGVAFYKSLNFTFRAWDGDDLEALSPL